MVPERSSVTIEAAAQWVDVDIRTIRDWSASGVLEIELRGDMEVVSLDRVRTLANRLGSMQALLCGFEVEASRRITRLQRIVRERWEADPALAG